MDRKISSLSSRRRKTVSDIACDLNHEQTSSSKALQILDEMSPLRGPASRAIIKKVKDGSMRRGSCPELFGQFFDPTTSGNAVANAGFVRLVYKKARLLRSDRNCSYASLREVALDIVHAVRVSMLVRRFIALAKLGTCPQANKAGDDPIPPRVDFVVEATEVIEETEEEDARHSWDGLLSDLSPVTPQVSYAKQSNLRVPKLLSLQTNNGKVCSMTNFVRDAKRDTV